MPSKDPEQPPPKRRGRPPKPKPVEEDDAPRKAKPLVAVPTSRFRTVESRSQRREAREARRQALGYGVPRATANDDDDDDE